MVLKQQILFFSLTLAPFIMCSIVHYSVLIFFPSTWRSPPILPSAYTAVNK